MVMVVVSIISRGKYQGPIEPLHLPMGCFCISTSNMEERCWTKAVTSGISRILAKYIQGGREVVQIVDLPMDQSLEMISTCYSTKGTRDTTWYIGNMQESYALNLLPHCLDFLDALHVHLISR